MLSKYKLNQLYFKDTQFANLMTRRIFNVLLIANPYDAFMLEDDGRIDEKIFNEYTSLSLLSAAFLTSIYGGRGFDAIGEYVVRPGDLYAEYG